MQAKSVIEDRRVHYNEDRPHSSIDGLTPKVFKKQEAKKGGEAKDEDRQPRTQPRPRVLSSTRSSSEESRRVMLDVSEGVMATWRLMVEQGRKSGCTHSQPDLIIDATARQHGLVVVTRDNSEYRRAKVAVFDPWRDGSI